MENGPLTLIVFALLKSIREDKGTKHCRKHLVGPIREILEKPLSPAPTPGADQVHREAAAMMAGFCRLCDGCELARRLAA